MATLRSRWESWRSSLWFVPTVLVLGAVVLAQGLIEIDRHIDRTNLQAQWPRLFGAGAAGSRGMLTAIASSMITVAGVAFSITIVALVLASSQYTSRILRNFMRDRASQTVLGTFVGIFVYCLVVLRSIRGGDEGAFVPSLAVLFAVALGKWIGAFAAALGGLNTLVFAGGIGENAPLIRTRICDGLGFLGIDIDDTRNTENAALISTDAGRVAVRVIRTDEELMIARSVIRVLGLGAQNER